MQYHHVALIFTSAQTPVIRIYEAWQVGGWLRKHILQTCVNHLHSLVYNFPICLHATIPPPHCSQKQVQVE